MKLLERGARRLLTAIDATATRLYGAAWNPVHQSGTVSVAMLLVLIGTGLYLLLFYRLGSPAASVATPWGLLNSPLPLPSEPHWVRYVPVLVNFWMRRLPVSVT